jgi:competence protein ComEA
MILNLKPVKDWFGFTRRERRSTSILLAVIFIIIAIRYVFPEQNINIESFREISSDTAITGVVSDTEITSGKVLFAFDPNIAPYDTLVELGFSSEQAGRVIKYRRSGGKFRKPADIKKVYGVDSTFAENLASYIVLSPGSSDKSVNGSPVQEKPLIDLNKCDSLQLAGLPGIGPVLSVRIIKYRNLLGGFATVEQLKEVYGLPAETYEMIKGRLFADSSAIRKANINSAGYRELSRLPYLEKYDVSAILKYRELTGRINSIEELKENKILAAEKAGKVEPYLDFK